MRYSNNLMMDISPISKRDLELPALSPPPGVTSNFVNPESRGSALVIASAICITFMVLFLVMRFYTKICIKHTLGWDDYICVPAAIGAVGFAAVSISMLDEGVGPHQWNVSILHFTSDLLRKFIVVDVLYSPTILTAKLSLLFLYLEVFRPNIKLRYFIYFGIAVISMFYVATTITFAVLTIPKRGQSLLGSILSANTAKAIPLGITQGSFNVASDFYIILLPIPGVWQLQLPLRKKIGICAIFMTGLLACLSSVIGLYYRTKIDRSTDVTWNLVPALLWVVVELTVGVICGCMPAFASFSLHHLPPLDSLRSLFGWKNKARTLRKLFSWSSGSDNSKKPSTKDLRVTLGSRIDGKGHFTNSTSVFGKEDDWMKLGDVLFPKTTHDESNGTRREWHEEMAEAQRQSALRPHRLNKHSSETHIRSSYPRDLEMGLPQRGIRVESQVEFSWVQIPKEGT